MNLLMISPMYPSMNDPVYGTFIKTYMDSFTELNQNGQTQLICIKGRSYSTTIKIVKYLWFYLKMFYYLIFRNYDIIYVQTITTTILPIKIISYFKHLNTVYNVHGADVITTKTSSEYLKQVAIPLLYRAKLIVTPSEYYKEIVIKMLSGICTDKIYVSPSGGVDLQLFKPMNKKYSDKFVLGFVSRIDYGKGWDLFVRLIGRLKSRGIKVKGVIAGRGAEENSLHNLLEEEKLTEEVEYIGAVAHSQLPHLFNKFDVFIFPTIRKSESLGLVGVEALACGIPVIGSNVAGLPGFINNGKNGFLFEPGNLDDLYQKVIMYKNMSEKQKEEMSYCSLQTAKKFETNEVMFSLYNKIKNVK